MIKSLQLKELINIEYIAKNPFDQIKSLFHLKDNCFNYQGQFHGCKIVNGVYDFKLRLFSSHENGLPMSRLIKLSNVRVVNSKFKLNDISFDDALSLGIKLWLQIQVKLKKHTKYTIVSTLQKSNSIPYSTQADFITHNKTDRT